MKRLGTVLHMTHNGYIVAKLEQEEDKLPPLNVPVYDRDLNKIGTLLDIIGPVKNPYAVVKPVNREVRVYEGEPLYYKIPRPRYRKPRRKPRRAAAARRERRERGPAKRQGQGRRGARQGRGRGRGNKGSRGARR